MIYSKWEYLFEGMCDYVVSERKIGAFGFARSVGLFENRCYRLFYAIGDLIRWRVFF